MGAKLDSIADMVFGISLAIVLIPIFEISLWLWICISIIILIRISAYLIGYMKFHAFSSLHTYSNKFTGFLIFCTPVLYEIFDISITGVILCLSGIISALEELVIIIMSEKLNRNCRSIFGR